MKVAVNCLLVGNVDPDNSILATGVYITILLSLSFFHPFFHLVQPLLH